MSSDKLDIALTNIKEIKKENKEKEEKIKTLKDEIALNNSKICWLKEDIEDMVCNCFSNVSNVSIANKYITIENRTINVQEIINFAMLYNVDLKGIEMETIDNRINLYIKLKP